jgi:hypothetical protein
VLTIPGLVQLVLLNGSGLYALIARADVRLFGLNAVVDSVEQDKRAVEVDAMRSKRIPLLIKASPLLVGVGLWPWLALAGSHQVPAPGMAQTAAASATPGAANVSSLFPAAGVGVAPTTRSSIDGLEGLTPAQRRVYQTAASTFSSFCHEWERLLHERELNNLDHLTWRNEGGLETATYTGYGKVESCECKASKEGFPIGKIRYSERIYAITGKTIEEARRAAPKLTHETKTLEIFSWDKGKWFY